MPNLGINIDLVDTDAQITSYILKCLSTTLSDALIKCVPNIKSRLSIILANAITSSAEYQSIISGPLHGEFGIVNPQNDLLNILNVWLNSIQVYSIPINITASGLHGGLLIRAIQYDFADVTSISSASFVTEKGVTIPWLEWLLKAGTAVVVRDYRVQKTNSYSKRFSRTGEAIMISSKVQFYRVPSQYAGTLDDNMVSRAILGVEDIINTMIQEEFEKQI